MLSLLLFAVLCTSCLAAPSLHYSYSPAVGPGSGTSFSTIEGDATERVTGIRMWEANNAYITGLQLRYGLIWSQLIGHELGDIHELKLFDGEAIVQVSGKYTTSYITQLIFLTSRGRFVTAGQPSHISFNFYATHPTAELKMLSGRYNSNGLRSVGAHWGVFMDQTSSNSTSH